MNHPPSNGEASPKGIDRRTIFKWGLGAAASLVGYSIYETLNPKDVSSCKNDLEILGKKDSNGNFLVSDQRYEEIKQAIKRELGIPENFEVIILIDKESALIDESVKGAVIFGGPNRYAMSFQYNLLQRRVHLAEKMNVAQKESPAMVKEIFNTPSPYFFFGITNRGHQVEIVENNESNSYADKFIARIDGNDVYITEATRWRDGGTTIIEGEWSKDEESPSEAIRIFVPFHGKPNLNGLEFSYHTSYENEDSSQGPLMKDDLYPKLIK